MSSDNSKPANKTESHKGDSSPLESRVGGNNSGRVKFDDRGNAVWEWSVTTGAFARGEVTTDRLKKLENPSLAIADDVPVGTDAVRANPHGTKKGYDPYDSGKLGKPPAAPARKKDLRKLSEWLKLKKQAGSNKDED